MINPTALQQIFDKAVELPPSDRRIYLDQSCSGDTALRLEVERLLAAYERLGSVFDSDAPPDSTPSTPTTSTARPLSLTSGTSIGPYEIVSLLGRGGMGEVYKARDPRLRRDVAIKVLPPEFATDKERLRRFELEALATAALNHPNIVTIFSVEHAGELLFLTMELLEGRTLAEMIPPDGLPLEQFFALAIPIADAVSAAHQRGIVHRDLKPLNIMVTTDGRVKVLDFGLAKLRDETAAPSHAFSSGQTHLSTGIGPIVGTVAYMSPEQAGGKPTDQRSDIFSLGTVLYEMATGRRPFGGDTQVSVLSAILKDTPSPVTAINQGLPRDLWRIIRHALAKEPSRRFQTATDLRNELEDLRPDVTSGDGPMVARTGRSPSLLRSRRFLVMSGVVAVLANMVFWWAYAHNIGSKPFEATFTQVTSRQGVERYPSLSPDGRWIIYESSAQGNFDIYLQAVGGRNAINLTKDSSDNDTDAAFSPNGELIAFRSGRQGGGIFVMGRTGESVRRVTPHGYAPAWSPDGQEIVYTTEHVFSPMGRSSVAELWIVTLATGAERRLFAGDAVEAAWSPHGNRIAYWGLPTSGSQRDIWTIAATGESPIAVTSDAAVDWNPVWSPDGSLLYFLSNRSGTMNLWRVPIDESSGRVLGPAVALTTPSPSVRKVSMAADGSTVAYSSLNDAGGIERIGFDPGALNVTGTPTVIARDSQIFVRPDVSPDGQWVAFEISEHEDIGIVRSDGTGLRQVTVGPAIDRGPRWSPDGRRIAFYSNRSGVYQNWIVNADGSGVRQLTASPKGAIDLSWSPDGQRIAAQAAGIGDTTWVYEVDRPWQEQVPTVLRPKSDVAVGLSPYRWSPDGAWLAGESVNIDGIALYSFLDNRFSMLTSTGRSPAWTPDGRQLIFVDDTRLVAIDVATHRSKVLLDAKPDEIAYPTVSRDGRDVYFTRLIPESDVWLMRIK